MIRLSGRLAACFSFLFVIFFNLAAIPTAQAQTGNLILITQDFGANSPSGLDNAIDIYSVVPFGLSSGAASLLNSVTATETYVTGNGVSLPGNEMALPISTNTPDFLLARVYTPNGAVTGLASTGTYLGGPQVLANLTGCPQLGGALVANYYTASSNYGLALADPYSGAVNINAFPQNSSLQYFQLPIQSTLDCSSPTPALYRIVESSSFTPGLPSYSVESYTYNPALGSFAATTLLPGSQNSLAGIQVVVGGWVAVISQSTAATIKIYDPMSVTPGFPIFTQNLPSNAFPLQGLNAYDAASNVLYVAVGISTPGNPSGFDIYYFDFNSFSGNLIGLNGLVPRTVASGIAALTLQ